MTAPDDIQALIEMHTRREAATHRSSHSQKSYAGPRADAESSNALPVLMWPDEAHKRPRRCPRAGCGSTFVTHDPPTGWQKYGDSTCGLCSRQIVRWQYAGTRPVLPDQGADTRPKRGRPALLLSPQECSFHDMALRRQRAARRRARKADTP